MCVLPGLLFIPEGWWHQVDSDTGTIALNYCVKSPLYHLLNNPSLTTYVVRAALHRSVDYTIEAQLHTAQQLLEHPQATGGTIAWLRAVVTGRRVEELQQMVEKLLDFASREPDAWTRLLLEDADPYAVELLTSAWEAAQMHGWIGDDFYTALFEACGAHADDWRVRVIQKKDRHREQTG